MNMGRHRVFPTRSLWSNVARLTALVLLQPVNVHSGPGDLFDQFIEPAEESSNKRSFGQYQFDPAYSLFSEWHPGPAYPTHRSYEELGEPLADLSANPALPWSTTFSYAADHIPREKGPSVEEQIREAPTYLSARRKEEEDGRSSKKSKLNSPSGFGTGSNFASSQRESTAPQIHSYQNAINEYGRLLRNRLEEIEGPELFNFFYESHQGTANNLPTHDGLPRVNSPTSLPTTHLPSTNKLPSTSSLPNAESKEEVLLRLEMNEANDETYAWIGAKADLLEMKVYKNQFNGLYQEFFDQVEKTLDKLGLGSLKSRVIGRMKGFLTRVWNIHSHFLEMLAISAEDDRFELAQANLHKYLLRKILSSHEAWLGVKSHSAGSGPSSFGWLHSQLSDYLTPENEITRYALLPNRKYDQVERRVTEQTISMTRMAVEIVGTYYKSLHYDKWRQFFEVDDQFLLLLSIIRWKLWNRDFAKYIDIIFPEMSKVENVMPWKEVLSNRDLEIINTHFKRHFELEIKNIMKNRLVPASMLTWDQLLNLKPFRGQLEGKRIVTLKSIEEKKQKSQNKASIEAKEGEPREMPRQTEKQKRIRPPPQRKFPSSSRADFQPS